VLARWLTLLLGIVKDLVISLLSWKEIGGGCMDHEFKNQIMISSGKRSFWLNYQRKSSHVFLIIRPTQRSYDLLDLHVIRIPTFKDSDVCQRNFFCHTYWHPA
jgi:hypothetical protein